MAFDIRMTTVAEARRTTKTGNAGTSFREGNKSIAENGKKVRKAIINTSAADGYVDGVKCLTLRFFKTFYTTRAPFTANGTVQFHCTFGVLKFTRRVN